MVREAVTATGGAVIYLSSLLTPLSLPTTSHISVAGVSPSNASQVSPSNGS